MKRDLQFAGLTGIIRNCAYVVYRELGTGFLEKVYENARAVELENNKINYQQQKPVTVKYQNRVVGEYIADLVVEGKIIIELKAVKEVEDIHYAQLFNYLKATGYEVGLLINFGPRFTFR